MAKLFEILPPTCPPVARRQQTPAWLEMLAINYIAIGTSIMVLIFIILTMVCK